MPMVVPADSSDTDVTIPQQSRYINLVTYSCLYFSAFFPLHHPLRTASWGCHFFQPARLIKTKKILSSEVPLFLADGLESLEPQRAWVVSLHVAEGGKNSDCSSFTYLGSWRPLASLDEILLLHCGDYMLYKAGYIASDEQEETEHSSFFLKEMREWSLSNGTSKIRQLSLEPLSWMLLTTPLNLIMRQQLLEQQNTSFCCSSK